jgi:surface antigen/phage tail protein X
MDIASRGNADAVQANVEVTSPSVDQLTVATLAAQTAAIADLSVASEVSSMSIDMNVKSELAQVDNTVITKPQVFEPISSGALTSYRTVVGDTVPAIAARYGISDQTLRWANNLVTDALAPDTDLTIPTVDGVVYTTKDGDTIESIASKYQSDQARIISKNDLELTGITSGQRIVLPGGILPENERPGYVAPRPVTTSTVASYSGGSTSYATTQAGNRYSYGYCTWYVYNRRAELGMPIGSLWGNASSWAYMARAAGYLVDHTPTIGSIMQDSYSAGGLGHVAVVESIGTDGSITISEMNYAGWNVKSYRTLSAGQAAGYNFIH